MDRIKGPHGDYLMGKAHETRYDTAIMRLMIELMADFYPDKTAVVTCSPSRWQELRTQPPKIIYNIGEMTRQAGSNDSTESVEAGSMTSDTEYLVFNDFREELRDPGLSGIVIDHMPLWTDHSVIAQVLPEMEWFDIPIRRSLEGVIGIMASAMSTSNIDRIVSVVRPSLLFGAAHSDWRRAVSHDFYPRVVVELPMGVIYQNSGLGIAVLYLERYRGTASQDTIFIALSELEELLGFYNQVWFNDVGAALAGHTVNTSFRARVPSDGPWNSGPYSPEAAEIEASLANISETQRLGDICEIIFGAHHGRPVVRRSGKPIIGIPVIRGRDISKSNIETKDLERFGGVQRAGERDKTETQLGDILMQRIGTKPAAIVVTEALEGSVVGNTVIILRPKGNNIPSEFIAQFLTSSVGQKLLAARRQGVGAPTLNRNALQNIPIPILSAQVMQDLDEMAEVEYQLLERVKEVHSLRMGLYGVKDKEGFEQHLYSLRTQLQVLSSTIIQVDDLRFQIRNFYPLPLAYSFRLLDGITSPPELYREQLRVTENLLAFLGSISLALIEPDRENLPVNLAECWRGGISPGHWETISNKSLDIIQHTVDDSFASVFRSLWRRGNRESDFAQNIKYLINIKNDFKHDRGPRIEEEFKIACESLGQKLENCMAAISFFARYPTRLICNLDVVRGTSTVILDTLRYMGDHPGLTQEKVGFPTPLPRNTLYMELSQERWVSLFPFITVQLCPECHIRETYFIDRWQGQGSSAKLKSFERGHTINSAEIGGELEKWITHSI